MSPEKLGPYRIEQVLGRGGMGTVYAAVDEQSGTRVAVKQLAAGLADNEHFRKRFEAEIEALIKLKHPHVVQILGHGEQDGQLFFAMELVEGSSLADELKTGRSFNWREVTQIGIDICSALRHAHDRGIIHRDLKPGNLLIDPAGNVKLTDFGIAKLFGGSQLTAVGGVIGTADYMSPEQARGQPVTLRSDLYSLGSVLFALLTRRPPFSGKTLPETVQSVSFEQAPPVSRFVDHVPHELEAIIAKLLQKDPAQRIPTALSVANRLRALQQEDAAVESFDTHESALDHEFDVADPDRTVVPETSESRRGTAPLAKSPRGPKSPADPSDRSTAIPQTILITKAGDEAKPAELPIPRASDTHFTPVDDQHRRQAEPPTAAESERGPLWPFALGLAGVVVLAAIGVTYSLWPPSADTLFRQISDAAGQGDLEQLAQAEDQCRAFVRRFPDDQRTAQVEQYLLRIESSQYPRRVRQKARLRGFDSLTAVEQVYLQALEESETEPGTARGNFQALVDTFGPLADDSRANRQCVAAARLQIELLASQVEQSQRQHLKELEKSLRRADQLRKDDPQAAAAIWQGIVRLYGDKPWAHQPVKDARSALAEFDRSSDGSTPPQS